MSIFWMSSDIGCPRQLTTGARIEETRSAASLDPCITPARGLLMDELQQRFFDARPSDAAMILMHMTKQGL